MGNAKKAKPGSMRDRLRRPSGKKPAGLSIEPAERAPRTVMVFGTFDSLHEGHKNFLLQARGYGDRVLAVVARDKNVERLKCKKPLINESLRLSHLEASGLVEMAILGSPDDFFEPVRDFRPDIICLGYDQEDRGLYEFLDSIKGSGYSPLVIRLFPYRPLEYKSSLLNKNGSCCLKPAS